MASNAWHEGYHEYSINPEAINPYDFDSVDYIDWEEGLAAALLESSRKYDDRYLDEQWVIDSYYDDDN